MELHHNWRVHLAGPAALGAGILSVLSPWLLALDNQQFVLGDWVGYVMAAVFFIATPMLFLESSRPLGVQIDPEGISWRKGKQQLGARWQDMVRVSIEKAPNSHRRAKPNQLTVWTPPGVISGDIKPDVELEGLSGYRVADLMKVKESAEQVDGALRHFAAGRYVAAAR